MISENVYLKAWVLKKVIIYSSQIGQYLMTLPQHLEPLLVNHSPALNRALQEANTTCSSG